MDLRDSRKLNPYGPTTKETGHSGYLADGGEAQIKIDKSCVRNSRMRI